jgi:hypothetical protein
MCRGNKGLGPLQEPAQVRIKAEHDTSRGSLVPSELHLSSVTSSLFCPTAMVL